MRFALSTEQQDFAASLRDLLASAKTPDVIRSWGAGEHDQGRKLLRRLADTGVFGLGIAEEFGGLGDHPVDLVTAFVEVGRAGVPGPLVESAAAIPALLEALQDNASAELWLPRLADGDALGSLVLHPSTPRALDADVCDVVLHIEGSAVHYGNTASSARSVDAARRLYEVDPAESIATGADVTQATAAAFDRAALACAAQLLGAGYATLDMATEYAKGRVQFGRPIGEFQAIKHHLADAMVSLEMAKPLLYGAAVAVANNEPTASRDISAAKVACGDAAYRAARKSLQTHGAIGYTAEYDLSLWLTKIRALLVAWGTPAIHRQRVADSLRTVS
ncbi:acyl-CoA dehydrogenase family protein [Antrihabitans spumae]|jgi:alkylation response protein AidB-like acyl-CoA dehydrogenase|uniref:Acyl-CoA dehydrogenase family protein n=1 Tax=Antrihabitans spumae TaxID=3373370 RepID=A0ABW7K9Z2_9NOCA